MDGQESVNQAFTGTYDLQAVEPAGPLCPAAAWNGLEAAARRLQNSSRNRPNKTPVYLFGGSLEALLVPRRNACLFLFLAVAFRNDE